MNLTKLNCFYTEYKEFCRNCSFVDFKGITEDEEKANKLWHYYYIALSGIHYPEIQFKSLSNKKHYAILINTLSVCSLPLGIRLQSRIISLVFKMLSLPFSLTPPLMLIISFTHIYAMYHIFNFAIKQADIIYNRANLEQFAENKRKIFADALNKISTEIEVAKKDEKEALLLLQKYLIKFSKF